MSLGNGTRSVPPSHIEIVAESLCGWACLRESVLIGGSNVAKSHFFPGLVWEVVALSKLARSDKVEKCPDTGNYKYARPEASAEESCL
ncbi:hypothetical protein TNCV_183241 [Trichonephila clavipes]|nr:hypothetical protein TNCV_183241 [Trichonephila clavipes]